MIQLWGLPKEAAGWGQEGQGTGPGKHLDCRRKTGVGHPGALLRYVKERGPELEEMLLREGSGPPRTNTPEAGT